MNHVGSISAERAYTLAELSQILECSRESAGTSSKVKFATIRKNLQEIGCPIPKFGRIVLVPGRLILLALERQAMSEFDDGETA